MANIPTQSNKTFVFTSPDGRKLRVNSPDGSMPSEQEIDAMFGKSTPKSFGQQLGQSFSDIAKSAINPPYRTVAHTLQGIEQMFGGKGRTYINPLSGDVVPSYSASTPLREPIGLGIQTAALGFSPTAGGAMYGGGQGIEQGKSPIDILKQAILGAGAGKAFGIASGEPILPQQISSRVIPALQKSAMQSYKNVLGRMTPNQEKYIAPKLVSGLVEKKPFAWTREGLQRGSERKAEILGETLEEKWAQLSPDTKLSIAPVLKSVKSAKDSLRINGVLLEQNVTEDAVLNKMSDNLVSMARNKKISPQDLRIYRQQLDTFISARKKGFRPSDIDSAALNARRTMANTIRGEINKQYPDISKINQEFSFWNNMSDLLQETVKKQPRLADKLGGVMLEMPGGPHYGFFIKNLGTLIGDNVAWNSFMGSQKSRLVNLLNSGNIDAANYSLGKAIILYNQKLQKTGSKKPPLPLEGSQDPFLADLWKDMIKGGSFAGGGLVLKNNSNESKGVASTYGWGEKLNKNTANNEVFNPNDLTAASYKYPMNSIVEVTDNKTGKKVEVRINDLGPNKRLNRLIDLSQGAWRALGYDKPGLTNVTVRRIK